MTWTFTSQERFWLWLVALAGLLGPNGVFLYHALFRTDAFTAALQNPVALVFMVDAVVAMALLAFVFAKARVSHWGWFVALSLIGGLVFSIPAFLLRSKDRRDNALHRSDRSY